MVGWDLTWHYLKDNQLFSKSKGRAVCILLLSWIGYAILCHRNPKLPDKPALPKHSLRPPL
jgi:hypothetical protein